MGSYQIQELNKQTISEWLSLSPGTTTSIDQFAHEFSDNPQLRRFLVRSNGQAIARFSAEIEDSSMTIWWPTIHSDHALRQVDIFDATATHLVRLAQLQTVDLVECTMKSALPIFPEWRQHLLDHGFRCTSRKREWTKDLRTTGAPKPTACDAWQITNWTGPESALDKLYALTVAGTADRSNEVELRHGIHLGHVDWSLVAENDSQEPIGLFTAILDRPKRTAWTKYVGVVPQWRKRRVGEALLTHALSELAAQDFHSTMALIDEQNAPSIALHVRLGYAPTETIGETFHLEL